MRRCENLYVQLYVNCASCIGMNKHEKRFEGRHYTSMYQYCVDTASSCTSILPTGAVHIGAPLCAYRYVGPFVLNGV